MSPSFSCVASCHNGFACYKIFPQRRTLATTNALRGTMKRLKEGEMFGKTRKSGGLKSSICFSRSWRPCGLSRISAAASWLRLLVRIPPGTWMTYLLSVLCVVR